MDRIHQTNISFLEKYLIATKYDWLDYSLPINVSYFSSGGGTHLYVIENGINKFLGRINFYPGKNDWKVKKVEYEVLKEIEKLNISPKVFVLNEKNTLHQDFTIVEYIDGKNIDKFGKDEIIHLARDLKKLHSFPKQFNKKEELPYTCDIYNEFAHGDDKKIEKYQCKDIEQLFDTYNIIKNTLGARFNDLSIFDKCENLCLCHADLKAENILKTKKGIMLIDRECAGIDIPETDIGRLFSGCRLTEKQQNTFLKEYYGALLSKEKINRILSIKLVLDFFHIIEDYCSLKRKKFNVEEMAHDLDVYEKRLINTISSQRS